MDWEEHADGNFHVHLTGQIFHLIAFNISVTNDYYQFNLLNVARIIPRFGLVKYETPYGSFDVPGNWSTFGWFLKRSKYISCLKDFAEQYRKTYPKLFARKPRLPNSIVYELRKFRDWAAERGIAPMLFSGTLLGWYRECGIISHTHDVDFAVFIENYYDGFARDIRKSSFMKLAIRFNKPENLLEFKVKIDNRRYPMDIFFIYHNEDSSWTGGMQYNEKYRFDYPLIKQTCATDLLGYLMYVPCNSLDVIESDHGKNWTKPFLSSKFIWNKSPLNVRKIGAYNKSEMADAFIQYD